MRGLKRYCGEMYCYVALILLALAVSAVGATIRGLLLEEMAHADATHVVTITYDDLTNFTTASNSYTVSVGTVAARMGAEVTAIYLDETFLDANTNITNVGMSVGDGDGLTHFSASVELNSNNAAGVAWLSYGTGSQRVYSAADSFDFVFTPDSNNALATCSQGITRVMFRIRDARSPYTY